MYKVEGVIKEIDCVGIGPGGVHMLTKEAENRIVHSDYIIGAKRMTEALMEFGKPVLEAYKPEEILEFIEAHKELNKIVIALSGDTGFYSGAKKLKEACEKELPEYRMNLLPGISSVVYLAAKLGISWEDAALASVHGRRQNYIDTIVHNEKTFLLLGGESGEELCRKIRSFHLEEIEVYVGRRLSYKDEEVIRKKGLMLQPQDCDSLDVAFIYNPKPDSRCCCSIQDEAFARGTVPMTKSEVRTISIAKLGLTKDAVLYDIGAGTGSVSVEAALCGGGIKVFAVEKNPEGIRLIEENKRSFRCDWIESVEGTAPEVLRELPPPTHVFIGGSGGNLKDIIRTVKKKNPDVRIVLNAISLETIQEIMEAIEEKILIEPEIVQIAVSKAKKLGAYHLMNALNPVYIVTEGK